ncbi:PilN domain-containing protein [Candidatus Berkelbacteria bacterium]|nr:PilN domain-containing protein [Candidatus Berkelbacteria bacterium]
MPQAPDLAFPKLEDSPRAISATGIMLVVISVFLIALSVLTTLIAATKNSQKLTLERTKDDLTTQLNSSELASTKRQLDGFVQIGDVIKVALGSRSDWRGLFGSLNALVPTSVRLINLNLDEHGTMRIDGDAPDYVAIAKFVNSMEGSPLFTSVEVNTITPSGAAYRFSISVGVNLRKFPFTTGQPGTKTPGGSPQ